MRPMASSLCRFTCLAFLLAAVLAATSLPGPLPAAAEGNVSQAWREAGFDEYDASHWLVAGFDLDTAKAWRAAGFNASAAHLWKKRRFIPQEAKAWVAAGVKSSKKAARLRKKGVTPDRMQP
ncbi:MAG TPA: hypothetical protein ENJ73_04320 [Desulfobacterales bacterium]|nr:hypothetical protein [Desulfobacterales bacterium]